MVFVQVAFATSTVLPTGGSLPSASGLRLPRPDHVVDLLLQLPVAYRASP